MSLASLLPLATAALGPLRETVAQGVEGATSFWETLRDELVSADAPEADEKSANAAQADDLETLTAGYIDLLRDRWARHSVDLSRPARLKSDGRGGVSVDGDHPDRVLIEGLFASDAELRDGFDHLVKSIAASVDGGDRRAAEDLRVTFDGQTLGYAWS